MKNEKEYFNNQKSAQKNNEARGRIRFYESFGKVAQRLKSQGLLNEENYAKLKERNVNIYFGISILYIVIAVGLAYCGVGFVYILLSLFFAVLTILSQKRTLNKFCYLYTFGEVVEGELLVVDRMNYLYPNNYSYNLTFEFMDSKNNINIAQQKQLHLNPNFNKIYEVGDKILIYYNPKNSRDALVSIDSHNFYNLSLATKTNNL